MIKSVWAVDPGSEQSASVIWTGEKITDMSILKNEELLGQLKSIPITLDTVLVIEMPQCFGMAVGKTIFETIFWIGRFCEAWPGFFTRVYRSQIKMHFCNSMRAKDTNIRQALIDRLGMPGTRKNPGILYGVKRDLWSALAIGVFFQDKEKEKRGGLD